MLVNTVSRVILSPFHSSSFSPVTVQCQDLDIIFFPLLFPSFPFLFSLLPPFPILLLLLLLPPPPSSFSSSSSPSPSPPPSSPPSPFPSPSPPPPLPLLPLSVLLPPPPSSYFPPLHAEQDGSGAVDRCIFFNGSNLYSVEFSNAFRPVDAIVGSCRDLADYWEFLISIMSLSFMGLLISVIAIITNCITPCVEDRYDSEWSPGKTDV